MWSRFISRVLPVVALGVCGILSPPARGATAIFSYGAAGTNVFTAVRGHTNVTVELWGAGAPGFPASPDSGPGGSGGGGGAYSRAIISVVPGQRYTNFVGKSLYDFNTFTLRGQDSWFVGPIMGGTSSLVIARGGGSVSLTTAGGAAFVSQGVTSFGGGTGSYSVGSAAGGGGGGSATSTGPGGDGEPGVFTSGNGGTGEGAGGHSAAFASFGPLGAICEFAEDGHVPGGGGGGSVNAAGTSCGGASDPGMGGNGRVVVQFEEELPVLSCPPDVSLPCGASTDPSETGVATATDDLSAVSNIVVSYTDLTVSNSFCDRMITRTWKATDEAGLFVTCEQLISMVRPPDGVVFHVTTNGSDSANGMSWTNAKRTIQAAVDLTIDGDTVLASNGVYATSSRATPGYSTSNRVVITNNITVRGFNGPAVTAIRGVKNGDTYASIRCVYMTAGTLSGFTLTNGYAPTVAPFFDQNRVGGGVYATGGTITNCNLTGNASPYLGGGSYGGTFYNCTLSGNLVTNGQGGGAAFGVLNDCTLSGNGAYDGGGAANCTLNRCRLTGNLATNDYGGGAYLSTLNNCLLSSNRALVGAGAVDSTLNNCTVFGNAAFGAGGTYLGTLNNCIVYFNTDTGGGSPNYFNGTINYSCTTPNPGAGSGNITNQPRFVATNTYLLATNSPCIDAGNNPAVSGADDLDGRPRIINDIVDMGAYEVLHGTGYWAWVAVVTNGMIDYTDSAAGDGDPNLVNYATGGSATNADGLGRLQGNLASNDTFTALFTRNTNATDVTIYLETADSVANGAEWAAIATNVHGTWGGSTNVVESGTGTPVSVNVRHDSLASTNRFTRLRVTRP